MFKLSSRSATVLVIFIVACIAFCLASVFAAMTGPISILPNESEPSGVLDNLSAITDSDNYDYQSYGYDDSKDYSSTSEDSEPSEEKVETTADTPQQSSSSSQSSSSQSSSSHSSSSNVETTSEPTQSSSSSSGSQVETTVDK